MKYADLLSVLSAQARQHPSLVLEPRGEHSRKPDVFHRIIEKVSPGPYVELFARRPMPGWEVWGNAIAEEAEARP
jgi:N6-adenosine-specific RNA methylase IME4